MGRGRKAGIPKPHPHRASGQDRVLINGNHEYLGPIGSEESKAKYQRLLAKWLAAKQADVVADPSFQSEDITIAELALAHLGYCDRRYRNKRGEPTGEADNVRDSIRELLRLFRDEPAREFGPKKLRAVRKAMVEAGLSRSVVNRRIKRCVRVFKWGVGEELLSPSVHQALAAVEGLRAGERVGSQSPRETAAVKPVEDMRVDAVKPFVSPQIWAMIELLRFTGMRPGEAMALRTCDIDDKGAVWTYSPDSHKTEHKGKVRRILIGPRAQEILKPWLRPSEPRALLFQPREAEAERKARRRASRKSKVQPSQVDRSKADAKRKAGDSFGRHALNKAINRACKIAGVDPWSPNQLRHSAATRIRAEFGLDAARAVLGHSSSAVTEIYAERDFEAAKRVAAKIG